MTRRIPVLVTGAALVAAGSIGLWTAPARAAISFAASGTAYGLDAAASGAAMPLGATPEGASPVAQAVIDSLGTSKGFASSPYPGDFVMGNYGLVAGLSGQPVPGYPLIVSSDAATNPEPAAAGGNGFSLSSKSDPGATKASADQGASSSGNQAAYAEAEAAAERHDDGSVEVRVSSLSSGFTVPGVLGFGTVTTEATAEVRASGELATHSDLQVTGATVNGQAVGFANGQFVVPGSTQPLPGNPFDAVLAQAGVKVTYVGAQKLPNGVESPGIQVTVTEKAPDGNPVAGTYTVTYTLGRSIATIEHGGSADQVAPSGAQTGTGTGSLSSAPAAGESAPPQGSPGAGAATATLPTTGSAADAPTTGEPAPATASPPSAPAAGRATGTRGAATSPAQVALAGRTTTGDMAGIYLVLVLAGVLLIASTGVVRYLGVRSPWTS